MSVSKLKSAISDAVRLISLWHNASLSITNILNNIEEIEKTFHAVNRYHDSIFFSNNNNDDDDDDQAFSFTCNFKAAYSLLSLRLHSENDNSRHELKQYWRRFQDLCVAIQKTLHDGIIKLLEETQSKLPNQIASQSMTIILVEEVLSAQSILTAFVVEFARKRLLLQPILDGASSVYR